MKDIYIVNGVNTVVKNVTARRQQDSEVNDAHLEGYLGNVRRHPQHVVFDTQIDTHERKGVRETGNQSFGQNVLKKITLPEMFLKSAK